MTDRPHLHVLKLPAMNVHFSVDGYQRRAAPWHSLDHLSYHKSLLVFSTLDGADHLAVVAAANCPVKMRVRSAEHLCVGGGIWSLAESETPCSPPGVPNNFRKVHSMGSHFFSACYQPVDATPHSQPGMLPYGMERNLLRDRLRTALHKSKAATLGFCCCFTGPLPRLLVLWRFWRSALRSLVVLPFPVPEEESVSGGRGRGIG